MSTFFKRKEIFSEAIQNVKISSFLHFLLKLHSYDEWRYQRFEAWLENVAERGPLATVRGPLANTQKKKLEN